ncbi:MAG: hypothetical protein JOY91_03190, partial [Sinobacteraceae bacterium]|nr:hypothetical protein [Nevskiaceae bacterium]
MKLMSLLERLRTNRNALFWSLHTAGWAAYAVSQYFGALLYEQEKRASYGQLFLIAALAGFVFSMPLRYVYRRLWGKPPGVYWLTVLLSCYVIALALRVVISVAYVHLIEPDYQFKNPFELFEGT